MSSIEENTRDFTDKAVNWDCKLGAEGEITIPEEVREYLRVTPGDNVSIVIENGEVRLKNAMQFTFEKTHEIIAESIERLGIHSEEDAFEFVRRFRQEERENGVQIENKYFTVD